MAGRIAVGVDGSAGSRRALRWAIEEAAIRGVGVLAVTVWRDPVDPDELDMLWTDFGPARTGRFAAAEEGNAIAGASDRLSAAVAEMAGQDPPVEIEPVVLEGDPAQTLCRLSGEADLLVVGSRGHGSIVGLVLGSVSTACSHHSRGPLVIVPAAIRSRRDHVTSTGPPVLPGSLTFTGSAPPPRPVCLVAPDLGDAPAGQGGTEGVRPCRHRTIPGRDVAQLPRHVVGDRDRAAARLGPVVGQQGPLPAVCARVRRPW